MNCEVLKWHLVALFTACLWGCTFVASKILLMSGMTPAEIMCTRFLLAWVVMLCWGGVHWTKDEGWFVLLGLTGGSLYFLAENTAVNITSTTSTVALLVCTTPLITALLNRIVHPKEHLSGHFIVGSLIALVGVTLVVLNGVFILDDNPWVFILSIGASVMWGFYSLLIRHVEGRYSSFCITRKVFFWGVVTMLPVCFFEDNTLTMATFLEPKVMGTLLFLGLIASLGCFLLWNIVIRHIGIIASGNYLYFNPVTSLIVAHFVLSERITLLAILGCLGTILGVWMAQRKSKKN